MAVNANSWKRFPVADRDQSFNADEAIVRIRDASSGSVEKFASAFLWRNSDGPANNVNSYRLPVVDVINGKFTLIPHAVFTAAAILSGAHGGLAGVVGDEEKKKLKAVVTEIYAMLQKAYGDPRTIPPWLRGGNTEEEVLGSMPESVNSSGWSTLPVAYAEHPWSSYDARRRIWDWAEGDIRRYRKAFLWHDINDPEVKVSYQLPVADVVNGELAIVPHAVTATLQMIAAARSGVNVPDHDMDAVQAVAEHINQRIYGVQVDAAGDGDNGDVVTAAGAPVAPPSDWFLDPKLQGPTPLAVTADGRIMGHLAAWGVCHAGITNQCVMAPRTAAGYRYFLNGTVLTADGSTVKVGKITLGTGHADTRLGWIPAADHYDNTGTAVGIVAAGEDQWGIWVSGSVVPGTTDAKIAELRRSPLSGDWRRVNGNLELVAALAVNTPGFPIVSMAASGEPLSLCAAGVVLEDGTIMAAQEPEPLPADATEALERLARIDKQLSRLHLERRKARMNRINS